MIKFIFTGFFILQLGLSFLSGQNSMSSPDEKKALSAQKIVFLGVDFSKLRLLNSLDFIDKNGKEKCAALQYKYYNDWNEIFLIESSKFNPNELLVVNDHKLSLDKSLELNKKITIEKCIIEDLLYKISEKEVQEIIDKYIGQGDEEIGVLIIGESLSKKLERGAHIIVYFETKTGKILLSNRYEAAPTGIGFNYYWVNTIHKCLEQHESYVKKTRKKLKMKY